MTENPLLQDNFNTPHDTFPFSRITTENIEEAILRGIEIANDEIAAIVQSPEPPTFANTIAKPRSRVLDRAVTLMYCLHSACTSDALDALAERVAPKLTEHSADILQNAPYFARVKAVWDAWKKGEVQLDEEDAKLLDDNYNYFVENGANLNEADKATFRQITAELSRLSLQFSSNNLKAMNAFALYLTDEAQLDGLPDSIRKQAAQEAITAGREGGWLFTLHAPSYGPFMQYANRRDLREQMYHASSTMCTSGAYDNTEICQKIVNLRMQLAQLLGYKTYAEFALRERMAKTTERVYDLLGQLQQAYLAPAREEVRRIADFARSMEGEDFRLMPWDFAHYAHLLRMRDYNIDAEMVRPYFPLQRVIDGVFGLATTLYGITFRENKDIEVYHPDVRAYDVLDHDGTYLAVLYADFFPRDNKKSGAWMTNFKEQWHDLDGTDSRPHVSVTMNFTKPTAESPSLLTPSEVNTFLHEFGHALHGIFAQSKYAGLSGTNVYWDFVELPSQFMENYAGQREFLHAFARHYQTDELFPDELLERIHRARNFNVAYACIRQLSFGLLDMAYYTRQEPLTQSLKEVERSVWHDIQLLPVEEDACMTVHFGHIMAGGYAAGYYSYKWAEVLEADAFAYFKERGMFSRQVAQDFRDKVLSKGGTRHPQDLYTDFRGRPATIDALLKRDGINTTK